MPATLTPTNTKINKPIVTVKHKQLLAFRLLKFVLELAACLCVVFLLLEILFAIAGVGEQEVLQIDKNQGYVPFNNKSVCWRREGFSRTVFDCWGIPGTGRDIKLYREPGVRRIAMIGDSYVEALQVPPESTACLLLEKKLNEKNYSAGKFEILNFGVQAHNLSQTYVRLKDFVINFKPEIVILPIRPFATFILPPNTKEGFLGARPNFYLDQNGKLTEDRTIQDIWLKSRDARRMENNKWARKNLRLWGFMSQSVESFELWKRSGGLLSGFKNIQLEKKPEQPKDQLSIDNANTTIKFWWTVADALIGEIDEVCRRNGAKLIVVQLPGVGGIKNDVENKLLAATVSKRHIEFIDTTNVFEKENSTRELFINTHFNQDGNQLFAEQLFRRISKKF